MTEGEKKAFEWLDHIVDVSYPIKTMEEVLGFKNIIFNYVEKLQKENEELKNKVVKRDNEIIELEETAEKEFLTKQEVKENYIPKDKVRKLLEEYKDTGYYEVEQVLKELLEEGDV